MRVAIPPMTRFMRLTRQEGDCLIWTGHFVGSKSSYPRFQAATRKAEGAVYAHRWIYEQMIGPIPEGMEIDHVRARGCVGSACVNWLHLEPVTPAENSHRARLAVCRNGHDLSDPDNCQWDDRGRRRGCIICARDRSREYQRAKARRIKEAHLAVRMQEIGEETIGPGHPDSTGGGSGA